MKSKYKNEGPDDDYYEATGMLKYKSAVYLAEIYLEKGNFERAAGYIELFDKKIRYKEFCGHEKVMDDLHTAFAYARLYHGLGETDKAIQALLPYIFSSALITNEKLSAKLVELLEEKYSVSELKDFTEKAIHSLNIIDSDTGFIEFIGFNIKVHSYSLYNFDDPNIEDHLKLSGEEILKTVVYTNPIFKRYIK